MISSLSADARWNFALSCGAIYIHTTYGHGAIACSSDFVMAKKNERRIGEFRTGIGHETSRQCRDDDRELSSLLRRNLSFTSRASAPVPWHTPLPSGSTSSLSISLANSKPKNGFAQRSHRPKSDFINQNCNLIARRAMRGEEGSRGRAEMGQQ